jgi:hypothetical protein
MLGKGQTSRALIGTYEQSIANAMKAIGRIDGMSPPFAADSALYGSFPPTLSTPPANTIQYENAYNPNT